MFGDHTSFLSLCKISSTPATDLRRGVAGTAGLSHGHGRRQDRHANNKQPRIASAETETDALQRGGELRVVNDHDGNVALAVGHRGPAKCRVLLVAVHPHAHAFHTHASARGVCAAGTCARARTHTHTHTCTCKCARMQVQGRAQDLGDGVVDISDLAIRQHLRVRTQ